MPRWAGIPCVKSFAAVFSMALVVFAIAGSLLAPGCREQSTAPIDRNAAPQTFLVNVPGDSTTSFYRLRLHWTGMDPDGEVVAYEWAITESLPSADEVVEYQVTTRTDSVFTFTVGDAQQVMGHRFYVRAVDNEGKRDPTAAWTFFAARNSCRPTVWFTEEYYIYQRPGAPRPDTVRFSEEINLLSPKDTCAAGSSVHFRWTGEDCDRAIGLGGGVDTVGQVAGFTYKLGGPSLHTDYLGGSPADTMRTYLPDPAGVLKSGVYTMSIRARDDAGLSGDPAVRPFVYNYDPVTWFTTKDSDAPTDSFYACIGSACDDMENYQSYARGDTLPQTAGGVRIGAYLGADDHPRDLVRGIVEYRARLVQSISGGFWSTVSAQQVGERTIYPFHSSYGVYSGNFAVEASAVDTLLRADGTPARIEFFANRMIGFVPSWIDELGGVQHQLPANSDVLPVPNPPSAGLMVRFGARDPDFDSGAVSGMLFSYGFTRFPVVEGGYETYSLMSPTQPGSQPSGANPGVWVWAPPEGIRLPDKTDTGGDPVPRDFLPGIYHLKVSARERPVSSSHGFRVKEATIVFELQ